MSALPSSWLPEQRPDVLIALAGVLVSLALLPLWLLASSVYLLTIPVVLSTGCTLYLLSARRSGSFGRPQWTVNVGRAVPAQLVGIGLAATVVVATRAGGRTVPVLLLAGGVGTLVLLQIVFLSDEALGAPLILAQVLAHAFVVRYTGLFTTPGLVGVDNWTHVTEYAASILRTGSLAPMADVKYYLAPFHHLATVAGAELLGVSLRTGLYLVVGVTVVLSVVLVYASARYFVDVRWALFAAAAFAMADHAIRWGMHVIPTSLGLVFFLAVVFAVTRLLHAETGVADWALLVGAIIAITLTHQLSAFVSLVFLGSAVLAQVLVRRADWLTPSPGQSESRLESAGRDSSEAIADGASPAITGVVPLHGAFAFHLAFSGGVWAITPWAGERFLPRAITLFQVTLRNSAGFLNLVESGSGDGAGGGGAAAAGSTVIPNLASYVDAAGFLVLLLVTAVGSLALLRRHRAPQASHAFVVAVGVMLTFAFVLPLFGIRNFLPSRWYAFAYALMALVGAVGLRHLGDRFSPRAVGALFVVLLLIYPFGMVTAQKATLDDPTFEDQWPKYAYTESEIAAMGTIGEIVPANATEVHTDHPWKSAFTRSGAHSGDTINLSTLDATGSPYDRTIYRTYQSEAAPQFVTRGGIVVTRQVSREQVCPTTQNRVYNNQDATLCSRPDV